MNNEKLLDAIGMIDDSIIEEAASAGRRRINVRTAVALVAAVLVCMLVSLPVLAASDVDYAYEIVYMVSPEIAQKLKPVNARCVDNGVEMQVTGAHIVGDQALIYINMTDLEGDKFDGTIDLYDSCDINTPYDCYGTCSFVAYDEATRTASFLVSIGNMNKEPMPGDKITFSVGCFLSGKQNYQDIIKDVDLGEASRTSKVQGNLHFRGFGYADEGIDRDKLRADDYLVPEDEYIATPIEGVHITALGFIHDKLHVQVYYENLLETDNHGFVMLESESGERRYCTTAVSFWDDERWGSYEEYIFDVSHDEIDGYKLYGDFVISTDYVEGNWQVTFPLENSKIA